MDEISLQLAELINQLKTITEKEEGIVKNIIALMLTEEIDAEITFADGLSLGAFASFSILTLESEIKETTHNVENLLEPLGLRERVEAITSEDIFRPDVEGDLFSELEKTRKKIRKRKLLLGSLEEDLLQTNTTQIKRAYSENFIRSLKKEWERGLRLLLRN
jgi:hypothetical protein